MNRKTLMIFVSIVIFLLSGFLYCNASPLESDVELGWPKGEYHVHFGADPVNLKNGNLYYPATDLFIPCVGFPLSVTRSYNSRSRYKGIFGFGWSSNLDIRVEIEKYKVVMMEADGFRETFTFFQQKGDVRRFRSSAESKTVEIQNNKITMINRQTREKRLFDDQGKILKRVDKYGNTLTYQYNNEGHLAQVIDTAGRAIEILTDPTGKVIQITDPILRVIRYKYDTRDNLIGVTDRAGHKTRFSYDKRHNLLCIDYPNGGSTKLSYDLRRGLIIKELGPERRSTSYRYKLDPKHPESWTVEVIDALKNVTRYDYSNNGYHLVITDALGGQVIKESCATCGGQLVSYTDARGNTTRYEYTSQEGFNITTITNPLVHKTITWYDQESGAPMKEIAPNGATTQYRYDQLENLIEVVDALENSTKYEYNNRGLSTQMVNARGATIRFRYDKYGNLISIIDPMGNETRFEYDLVGRLTKAVDALGNMTAFKSTSDDLIAMVEDQMGYKVYAEYNKSGQPVKTWDEKTVINRFVYNRAGDLLQITDTLNYKRKFTYDPLGRLVSFTNARGFNWSSRYDAFGREVETRDPLGHKETKQYDLAGNLVELIGPGGVTTLYEYDELDRVVKKVDPLSSVTFYYYDQLGNIVETREETGNRILYFYDSVGHLVKNVDNIGREYRYEYDAEGNRIAYWNPINLKKEYVYDSKNRLTKVVCPGRGSRDFKYDATDNPIQLTDFFGRKRLLNYDARHRLIHVEDYNGQKRTYKRDDRGNPLELIVDKVPRVRFSYDGLNRVVSMDRLSGQRKNYTYDAESNLMSSTDPIGRTKHFSYSPLNQLLGIRYPDGIEASYSYNVAGNLIRWKNKHYDVTAEYGPLGSLNLLKYTKPAVSLTMSYNRQGNLMAIELPDGRVIRYTYDKLQRLQKVSLSDGLWVKLEYDDLGRVKSRDYANGLTQLIEYSVFGRISTIKILNNQNHTLFEHYYKYDRNGTLVKKIQGDQLFKYYYQDDMLVRAVQGSWGELKLKYDDIGNRVKKKMGNQTENYEYNSSGQLIHVGSTDYYWNEIGNLVEKKNGLKYVAFKYTNDNLLQHAQTESGDYVIYEYDALRKLIHRKTNSLNDYLIIIDGTLLLIVDEKGTIKEVQIYEDLDRPIFSTKADITQYYHQDLFDNVSLITNAKGSVVDQLTYSPFGDILAGQPGILKPGYSARPLDEITRLYNMRFRLYEPSSGIFTTPDPLFNINPYSFARNNPLKFIDPFGMAECGREAKKYREEKQNIIRIQEKIEKVTKNISIKKREINKEVSIIHAIEEKIPEIHYYRKKIKILKPAAIISSAITSIYWGTAGFLAKEKLLSFLSLVTGTSFSITGMIMAYHSAPELWLQKLDNIEKTILERIPKIEKYVSELQKEVDILQRDEKTKQKERRKHGLMRNYWKRKYDKCCKKAIICGKTCAPLEKQ